MDASFDQFGGYGWGEQSGGGGGGGQDFNIPTPFQKSHITDKIPIPAIVEDLLTMSNDEEKYVIGGYSFNTVKIMGRIVSVFTDSNQCTTYEICDGMADDQRVAKRFTVIRYGGTDLQPNMEQVFSEGQTVQAVGKLRLFNNRLSLVSFHIRDVSMEEVEIYKMECKLAKYYFSKNLPENSHGLEDTIFRNAQTLPRPGMSSQATTTPGRSTTNMSSSITPSRQQQPSKQYANLSQQQAKIMDFIKRYGDANKDGRGVHVEQIRSSIKPGQDFMSDIQFLLDEGKIYTTLDDDHFSIIDDVC
uniref:Replication protein A C-terminal domain-containing protein n=1 Tax=Meloidogyne enterolobii TaxID=390850 RepID=A0A6V7UGP8_MELEN|nr:unnamed protein product [Meloidogyne enterolobii]